jgi:hypothetical protein
MTLKQHSIRLAAAAFALAGMTPAYAQLQPYRDYTVSDSVSNVTTVRVNANMIDYYLEGIRGTWVASNEAAMRLGQLQSYNVYVSDLPNSGAFNVLLVVRFANTSDLAPNRARYEAFMRSWGAANEESTRRTTTTVYPNLREITGEYLLREVTFLPQDR